MSFITDYINRRKEFIQREISECSSIFERYENNEATDDEFDEAERRSEMLNGQLQEIILLEGSMSNLYVAVHSIDGSVENVGVSNDEEDVGWFLAGKVDNYNEEVDDAKVFKMNSHGEFIISSIYKNEK